MASSRTAGGPARGNNRRLALRAERLTELTTAELAEVAGAANLPTHVCTPVIRTIPVNQCIALSNGCPSQYCVPF
jgi:hypothetical protein